MLNKFMLVMKSAMVSFRKPHSIYARLKMKVSERICALGPVRSPVR